MSRAMARTKDRPMLRAMVSSRARAWECKRPDPFLQADQF